MPRASLIAVDWGTSNLRASLLGAHGNVLETRSAAGGVMAVPDRRFAETLAALCGDWIETERCPLVASGMIGSRQGWREAPYLDCPAGIDDAAAGLLRIDVRDGVALHVVPGLRCVGSDGQYDVLRGEETQLWGAALADGAVCVLPGTHSKWARTGAGGRIDAFATYMTGELYALLTTHGILGRLMVHGEAAPAAFDDGAALGLAEHANATHAIFAARTAGLMERVAPAALPEFLSGILVGIEVGSATRGALPGRVALLGDAALCDRYARALQLAGIASDRVAADATTRGLWRMAVAAGLVMDTDGDERWTA